MKTPLQHPEHPIRAYRLKRELSLDELGRRAGIERSKLSRAERQYGRLSADEIGRVAKALGVPINMLEPSKRREENP